MITVETIAVNGSDSLTVAAARVSYGRPLQELDERDKRLLRRLARDGHNSPFYHPQITLRIQAPFFVRNQLLRHNVGLTVNELSRRYTSADITYTLPVNLDEDIEIAMVNHFNHCFDMYNELIQGGIKREQARAILPQFTDTIWLWTGSLYAFYNVVRQRTGEDVQPDCAIVAQLISSHLLRAFPESYQALTEVQNG